jgi:hypothetical protein
MSEQAYADTNLSISFIMASHLTCGYCYLVWMHCQTETQIKIHKNLKWNINLMLSSAMLPISFLFVKIPTALHYIITSEVSTLHSLNF